MPDFFRKHPDHGVHHTWDNPTIVFVTVCTQDRVARLSTTRVQDTLHNLWCTTARSWLVGDYVILPDHLHLFCSPAAFPYPHSVEDWVKFWKSKASQSLGWGPGRWQRDSFHHRIRDATDYQEKWEYFRANPVAAGLANSYEEWPYRGLVHRLGFLG